MQSRPFARAAAPPLRILAVCETWQGSNAYAFTRAMHRAGHSVTTLPDNWFVPSDWRATPLKVLRRLITPVTVREYTHTLVEEARRLRPHLFFVFKGPYVEGRAVDAIRDLGAIAVNYYPDISFTAHGPYIPGALPRYDWVFTTKTFGIDDMKSQLGITRVSLLPHGYDAETHAPVNLDPRDHAQYDCDASFIGTWSQKKEALLAEVVERFPVLRLKIWGDQWGRVRPSLKPYVLSRSVKGTEYAKAVRASAVNIAILSEIRAGASMGDQITSRTFHIPAAGGFMLHERTAEAAEYFVEEEECAMFEGGAELADKIRHFLASPDERARIAAAGRKRCEDSGYSIDHRAAVVVQKTVELLAIGSGRAAGEMTHRRPGKMR
jgi:glycosyltransferase involved in cell wall biosynthesis